MKPFCLGELLSSNTFVMQNTTFSKHHLIKISMKYISINRQVKTWYLSNDYSLKWNWYWLITSKLLYDVEELTLVSIDTTDPPIATLKQTIFCIPWATEKLIKPPGTKKCLAIPICCTLLTITCTLFSERPTNMPLFLVI